MRPPTNWSRWFLITGFLGALGFAVVTPPFEVPDEVSHFQRAYEVSEGELVSRPSGPDAGAVLPLSVTRLAVQLTDDIPFHPENKLSRGALVRGFAVPLAPQRRGFVAFSNSALTSFVPYLPSATGIALARLFTDSVLALFYAGRLANLTVAVLVTALAIRRTPFARPLFFLLASTPMATFERASVSADAFTDAIALYVVAALLDLAFGPERVTARAVVPALVACGLLGFSKTAYVFLTLLVFLVRSERVGSRWRLAALCVLTLGVAFAAAGGWSVVFHQSCPSFRLYPGTNPSQQLAAVAGHPFAFLATTARFYAGWAPRLAVQFVGRLGWLDTPLPRPLVAAVGLLIVVVAATSGDARRILRARHRLVLAMTAAVSVLWMSLLLYVVVSPIGSREIGGVQGRHLIPFAAPFFLSWAGVARPIDWDRRAAVIVSTAAGVCLVALLVVWRRYHA